MTFFASLRANLPDVTDALYSVGFGGNCQDGQSGLPLTSSYINAVLQLFSRCLVPTGSILMWSGASDEVPEGWAICDGDNDTPDLSGKFIIAATEDVDDYPVNSTGGSLDATTETAGTHSHTGNTDDHILTIEQMPRHSHEVQIEFQTNQIQFDTGDNNQIATTRDDVETDETGGGLGHSHSISDDGLHSHKVTSTPPYCALFYIMKL